MLNTHQIIGRLGRDPEVRHLENGSAVATFPVATSETYKDRNTGEKRELTEWHNVVLWRGLAEVAEKYLHKGDLVYISGKSCTRSWEKDGITRYTTELIGNEMKMLGSSQGNKPPAPGAGDEPVCVRPAENKEDDVTDDLPF